MENEKCLNNEISYFRFWIAFIAVILIMFLICVFVLIVIGLPFQFLPIISINIVLEIFFLDMIIQFVMYIFEKHKYKKALHDNWKQPIKALYCKSCLKFPDFIRKCLFKLRSHIVEPVLFYHLIYHFNQIKKGWDSAVKNIQYSAELDHDAIIVNIYSKLGKEYIFGDGVDLLVNFFVERKIPFKVFCCFNSEQFFNIVNNPKCKTLWLFGHGDRGGISCSDKFVDYSELAKEISPLARSKRYVYQFHCNSGCKNSLADYLSNGHGFANYRYLTKGGEVRGYIENILQDESWEN
jgi:hypothetical protein